MTTRTTPVVAQKVEQAAGLLRQAGVTGVLTYSDADCRLHALSLPELEPAPAPGFEMCRPSASTGGLGAVDGEVVWAGLGYGAVQVVLTRDQLSRAITGSPPDASGGFRAVQAVRLDDERMLVLADAASDPGERVLAAFDGPEATFAHLSWEAAGASGVRPSPAGGYYALMPAESGSVRVFTRDGHVRPPPEGVPAASAATWSPDERWIALATAEAVYVAPTEGAGPVIRIPLAVRDLHWAGAEVARSP